MPRTQQSQQEQAPEQQEQAPEQEQADEGQVLTLDYRDEGATPTPYGYLANGDLKKEHRDELAAQVGADADALAFEVVEDNIGHSMKVRVTRK